MRYKVGQTVYLLVKKSKKVFPVKVVEEITRKTVEGEAITYTGMLPDKDSTRIDLGNVEQDLHMTHIAARTVMIENATSIIDTIIDEAVEINKSVFGASEDLTESQEIETDTTILESGMSSNDENMKVDLGDGLVANVNLSGLSDIT